MTPEIQGRNRAGKDLSTMARRRVPKWYQAARRDPSSIERGEKPDWLSRALSRAGVLALTDAERAIRAGRVELGDRVVREPLAILTRGARVRLDGREVSLGYTTRVLMFHKMVNTVTARGLPDSVFERLEAVLPPRLRTFNWHAVGRLDRDTTGLLLFTNDERFVAHATSPATHLAKRYLATVGGRPTEEKLEPLRRGIELDDGATRPAIATLRGADLVELTLTEGRNHQVKRMLGGVGLPVRALHREAVGALRLDVPEGAYRELSAEEVRGALGFVDAR